MTASLLLVALGVAWAAFTGGGDRHADSATAILLVGVAGLVAIWPLVRRPRQAPDPGITIAAVLFPAYVALQLIPLPVSWLTVMSPARAELAGAVSQLTGVDGFAPITISTPTTWVGLSRFAGCTIVFLLVRAIAGAPQRRWSAAMPLVIVGTIVAAAALLAGPGEGGFTAGTFVNRNHFANLNAIIQIGRAHV